MMKLSTNPSGNSLWARILSFSRQIGNKRTSILNVITALLWTLLGIRAITLLDTASWDSMAYHLPFASRLAGIFPRESYLFYAHLEPLYDGGPKLAEFLQGVLWRITGLASAPNLVGFACLLLLAILTARKIRVPFWLVTLFFLSIPLVLIHSQTSMTDLPTNAFIAMAFVMFLAAFDDDRFDNKSLFFVLLPLAIAANMKYQGLAIAVPFWGAVLALFLFKNRRIITHNDPSPRSTYVGRFVLVNFVIAALFGWNYVANTVRFANPVYPLSVRAGPIVLAGPFQGPVTIDGPFSIQRGKNGERASYQAYLLSLSEIYLWTNNQGYLWSADMGIVWNSKTTDPTYKSGGFFAANLLLWTAFLLLSVFSTRKRNAVLWFLFVLGNFLFVGFLPGAVLLRYWLFLPLELAVLTLWMYRQNPDPLKSVFTLVIILQLAIFSFVAFENRNVFPYKYALTHLQDGVQNLQGIQEKYKLDANLPAPVCIVSSKNTTLGFLYKIANPEIPIQAALADRDCQGPTIVHP